MHTVVLTPTFLADLKSAKASESDLLRIVNYVARHPRPGDLMVGTGGARKVRIEGRGKGKSGGYRLIAYWAGEDVPVFLLALISKGDRANLSHAERNELRSTLGALAEDYRRGQKTKPPGHR